MALVSTESPHADRSAVYLVLLSRLVPLAAAPLTLWLVATRRPVAEQGLYFIFINVQAVAQLAEIGIGTLLVQFVSHESPHLTWRAGGALAGDPQAVERVVAVLATASRWYRRLAIGFFVVVTPLGLALLRSRTIGGLAPAAAWTVTVACTCASFTLVPAFCALDGAGRLVHAQRMRLVQATIAIAALWACLLTVGALWGVAAFALAWLATQVAWLRITHPALLHAVWRRHAAARPAPPAERATSTLIAQQRRAASAWLALWATPQCLVPLLLVTQGAAPAARAGMSLAIATAALTLASSWLFGRYPRYAALVASGATDDLARVARRATLEAIGVCVIGAVAAACALAVLGAIWPALGGRALTPAATLALGIGNIGWLLAQGLSGFLRAWRVEPLAPVVIGASGGVVLATAVAAARLDSSGAVLVHAAAVLLGVGGATVIAFSRHRAATASSNQARSA